MPLDEQSFQKRYWAFISYSHKDSQIAEKWHRKLETYRVPNTLVGTVGRDGVIPKRLFPIFRDRDELPTSSDLGANLREALGRSRFLIVIASPASASSRWVGEEVRHFKKVHRNGNVLALITSGEPNVTEQGKPAEECFCPGLRFQLNPEGEVSTEPSEPIAADIRPKGDGENRAFLKIVAGLIGVSFDDLFQRERRRQRQRMLVFSSLGILLAAALTMIIAQLSLFGKKQEEMIRQQRQIEEVVTNLKETGPYKEIGKLPEGRRSELKSLLESLAVESLIKRSRAFLRPEEVERVSARLTDVTASFVTQDANNWPDLEKAFIAACEALEAHVRELRPVEATIIIRRLREKMDEMKMRLTGFAENLEEKLVAQDIIADLSAQLKVESDRLPAARYRVSQLAEVSAARLMRSFNDRINAAREQQGGGGYPSIELNIDHFMRWSNFHGRIKSAIAIDGANPVQLMSLGDLKRKKSDLNGALEAYTDAFHDSESESYQTGWAVLVPKGPRRLDFSVTIATRLLEVVRDLEHQGAARFQGEKGRREISSAYGNLCWAQIFAKDFTAAINSGLAGQREFPQTWVAGNLAHAYLLSGDWEAAKQLYLAHRGKRLEINDLLFEDAVKADFELMNDAEIVHSDMIKVAELLGFKMSGNRKGKGSIQ